MDLKFPPPKISSLNLTTKVHLELITLSLAAHLEL